MAALDLPIALEPLRSRFEATLKPYAEIQARFTKSAALWQSKFAGLPYLPKGVDYPTTPAGDYLYLLAQINFAEVPELEGFPTSGILQFYLARDEMYGCNFDQPTDQSKFRVLFFPDPVLDETQLVTDFEFLPSLWEEDEYDMPFEVLLSYAPDRRDCLALSFQPGLMPITAADYQFQALIGIDPFAHFHSDDPALAAQGEALRQYRESHASGHWLGGYPIFTQSDPRPSLPAEAEPYSLLLQIDSEQSPDRQNEGFYLLWGDVGVANFFIKPSALAQLDFSEVLYNWDCC